LTLSASIELELMRAAMLLESDPAAAARQAIAVLASSPGHAAANLLLAAARRRQGGPPDALGSLESLAHGEPNSPLLQLELGLAYAACDRTGESIAALERAVELDGNLAEGWRALSAQQLRAGNTAAADGAYARYRRVAADPPELAAAYAAFDQGRLVDAEAVTRGRLPGGTDPVAAYTLLAAIAAKRGDNSAEEDALKRILSLAPCDNGAREQLARLLLRLERAEALAVIERLLLADPHSGTVLVLKAEALQLADRHDEALAIITGLLAREPHNPDYWLLAGNQQRFMGKTADAIRSYQRTVELRPGYGLAYWALSNLGTYSVSTAEITAMRRELNAAPAAGVDATHFEFALGRALETRLEFADSFEHYRRGNARARATFSYDANSMTSFVNRFKSTFTHRFFAERSHWGDQGKEAIFIVGLPRSGSTLLEQILASHSQVEGTRELAYIPAMARELAGSPETAVRYPENMPALAQSDIAALAQRYLSSVRAHRPQGKARFIDKMHGNFASLGLIQLMFPRAAIIDARRHPMGCGFACYKQLFIPGMNFAYELNELGLYYRDYVDLMEHIEGVLPQRVYRLHYESLVADTANEVQRILAYCDLPFEPGCLRFHENKRVVQTISSQQVRQPIYAEGVDQWRHFEPWLEPLRQPLQSLIEKYPRF
jgi:tetratricopeptide (TPR) repeat protein